MKLYYPSMAISKILEGVPANDVLRQINPKEVDDAWVNVIRGATATLLLIKGLESQWAEMHLLYTHLNKMKGRQ